MRVPVALPQAGDRDAHIRVAMTDAYARLTAMKLYAHGALDYLRTATDDRRLFPALSMEANAPPIQVSF